jgi:hypothetical protein
LKLRTLSSTESMIKTRRVKTMVSLMKVERFIALKKIIIKGT